MEKVYLYAGMIFKDFFQTLDKYSFAILSPSERSTFDKQYAPAINSIIKDKMLILGFRSQILHIPSMGDQ